MVRRSGGPRKNFARQGIPSQRLALKAMLKIWLSEERSWQIVRPKCMVEDAQSVTGFEGQLGDVAFPGKIMEDREAKRFE